MCQSWGIVLTLSCVLVTLNRPIPTRELSLQTESFPTISSLIIVEIFNGVAKDMRQQLLDIIQMQIILVTIQPVVFLILVKLCHVLDKLFQLQEDGEAQTYRLAVQA